MSYVLTGPWSQTKHLQYHEEESYGATDTSSPTFTNAGSIISLRENSSVTVNKYRRLGSETLYKALKTGEAYSFELVFQPTSTTLMRYASEVQGGGTGTIDKSLSFVYTEDINDTENFVYFEGSKCDKMKIEVTPASVLCTMNWICQNITVGASSSGLTTPTFASADTGTPWIGSTGASNPFTHNSNNYDVDNFTIDIGRNLDAIQPNGASQITFLQATNYDCTGSFDVLRKNTTLWTDMQAHTARTATYTLNSASSKTLTITNMRLETMEAMHDAGANTVPRDRFTWNADYSSITA